MVQLNSVAKTTKSFAMGFAKNPNQRKIALIAICLVLTGVAIGGICLAKHLNSDDRNSDDRKLAEIYKVAAEILHNQPSGSLLAYEVNQQLNNLFLDAADILKNRKKEALEARREDLKAKGESLTDHEKAEDRCIGQELDIREEVEMFDNSIKDANRAGLAAIKRELESTDGGYRVKRKLEALERRMQEAAVA